MGSTGINAVIARAMGLRLISDMNERLCMAGVRPLLDRKRQDRLNAIRTAGILFIHVPKNAGMAISQALYGCQVKHVSVRYYDRVAPELLRTLDSVAVIRDLVERFVSAYDYARAGGTRDNRISAPFRRQYRGFASLDDALDHVDHVFRPQAWYVADGVGAIRVRRLVRYERTGLLGRVWERGGSMPVVNRASAATTLCTRSQAARIRHLYQGDMAAAPVSDAAMSRDKPG